MYKVSDEDRKENIRRISEVSRLMLDAGPGIITLMGGFSSSINRICTFEVCVLRTTSGFLDIKNVSCISLAGWFSGKLRAVKLYQSSSISGPSSILKPISLNILIILFNTYL